MNFLSNFKIGIRVLLALVAPVIGLLLFSGNSIIEKQQISNEIEHIEHLAVLAPTISATVHELQKERGTSAGFIGSKGQRFADLLPKQRGLTDAKNKALKSALAAFDTSPFSDAFRNKISTATSALAQLDTKRQAISQFKLSVPQMAGYYTPTIAKLLAIVEEMAVLSSNAKITNAVTAYTSFLQAKERNGIERAMGAGGFGAGKFTPAVYKKFIELIAEQQIFFGIFKNYGTMEQFEFMKKTVVGRDVEDVARMRKIAIISPQTGTLQDIKGTYWYGVITKKIDLLKKVEDKVSADLVALSQDLKSSASASFMLFLAVTLILMVVTVGLVFLIVRSVTLPINLATVTTQELADGNTDIDLTHASRGDEIGAIFQTLGTFRDNIEATRKLEAEAEEQRVQQAKREEEERKAELDRERHEREAEAAREAKEREEEEQRLAAERETEHQKAAEQEERARVEQERADKISSLTVDFDTSVTHVLDTVSEAVDSMGATSKALNVTAENTSKQATTVSAAAEEASTNVQTVAAAAEELSKSITEISSRVSQSSTISANAVEEARKTNEQVKGLAEAANKIGEVVELINDIASQTNLLALNATIEAARAGDAGKGFAVVASEVGNLANQTAKATEDIANQISGIQSATNQSVGAIQGITEIIGEISEIASGIAAAVEEQGAATQEIARNVEQASIGTQDVTTNIVHVSNGANETGQAADQMNNSVTTLGSEATRLRKEVETFLNEIKAV